MPGTHQPQDNPLKVLAVDDNPNALSTIRNLLEMHDCKVESAADAPGALSMAKRTRFDAVVIDQLLPGKTGVELLREIRKLHQRQAAIIISGVEPTDDLKLEVAQLNAIFISKDNLPQLLDKLRILLERETNPIKVFISYTNPDYQNVYWIYRRLNDYGFTPWLDKFEVLPGFIWDKEVKKAIEEADFVLSCLSDIAVKRLGHFQEEIRLAVAKHDRVGEPFILPLRFDNCDVPTEFLQRNIQYINYDLNDEWWKRIERTLRSKRR